MLGENTISTKALDSDQLRIALLKRNGYTRTDRFHVLYSRSLVEARSLNRNWRQGCA